ncbi:thioredoxin [Bizionia sp. KMM 8389]
MSNFSSIINKDKPVLVDFFAEWCGPCKTMSPILKEVKDQLGDQVQILKIDVDKNQQLASKFNVRGVPTLILYKNGQQLWRQFGLASKRDLVNLIQSHV